MAVIRRVIKRRRIVRRGAAHKPAAARKQRLGNAEISYLKARQSNTQLNQYNNGRYHDHSSGVSDSGKRRTHW